MKKLFLVLIPALIFITGCTKSDHISDKTLINDKADELLAYLDNRDPNGLKGVFCQDVLNTVDIDNQIELFFEKYKGKVSSSNVKLGHSSESLDNGKTTERYISAYIYIENDNGNKYTIYYAYYPIIERNPSMQGIYRISITSETNDEYLIGKHISISDLK